MLNNAQQGAAKIVIEENIPIPEGNRYGQWTLVADKMEVGNSVYFKEADPDPAKAMRKSVQKALGLKNALRKAGKDCISRTMDGGVRVWCTKAPKKPKNDPPATAATTNGQAT